MTTEEYRNDMLYHAALSIGKSMLEKGLISEEEYAEMDTVLLQKYWYCMGKKKKGCTCGNKNFPDYHLRLISSYVMGTESFDEDAFAQQVEEIRVLAEGRLEYRFADGRTVTWGKA